MYLVLIDAATTCIFFPVMQHGYLMIAEQRTQYSTVVEARLLVLMRSIVDMIQQAADGASAQAIQ
jgi:hypothetical protein